MDEAAFDMAACLRRVAQKDEDAARLLVDRLSPLVLKLVRAHLPRRSSEEDLVQTIFMKVFAKLPQYSGKVPVEHWVSRIAVNTCFNELKAERIRPEWRWSDFSEEEQHLLQTLSSDGTQPQGAPDVVARDLLKKLLSGLNPQDRMVVQLLHLEERTVAEVRQMTGWSESMIKVRAFRARRKLKKSLQSMEEHQR